MFPAPHQLVPGKIFHLNVSNITPSPVWINRVTNKKMCLLFNVIFELKDSSTFLGLFMYKITPANCRNTWLRKLCQIVSQLLNEDLYWDCNVHNEWQHPLQSTVFKKCSKKSQYIFSGRKQLEFLRQILLWSNSQIKNNNDSFYCDFQPMWHPLLKGFKSIISCFSHQMASIKINFIIFYIF